VPENRIAISWRCESAAAGGHGHANQVSQAGIRLSSRVEISPDPNRPIQAFSRPNGKEVVAGKIQNLEKIRP